MCVCVCVCVCVWCVWCVCVWCVGMAGVDIVICMCCVCCYTSDMSNGDCHFPVVPTQLHPPPHTSRTLCPCLHSLHSTHSCPPCVDGPYAGCPSVHTHPIYNGAKPENPCSVFFGAFSGLLRENDDLPYAAFRPTSIRLSRDAKTATPAAGGEKIGVELLRSPCFPDNDAIFVRGCQGSARWREVQMQGARTGTAQPTGKARETPLLRDDFSIFHYGPVSKFAYSGA